MKSGDKKLQRRTKGKRREITSRVCLHCGLAVSRCCSRRVSSEAGGLYLGQALLNGWQVMHPRLSSWFPLGWQAQRFGAMSPLHSGDVPRCNGKDTASLDGTSRLGATLLQRAARTKLCFPQSEARRSKLCGTARRCSVCTRGGSGSISAPADSLIPHERTSAARGLSNCASLWDGVKKVWLAPLGIKSPTCFDSNSVSHNTRKRFLVLRKLGYCSNV